MNKQKVLEDTFRCILYKEMSRYYFQDLIEATNSLKIQQKEKQTVDWTKAMVTKRCQLVSQQLKGQEEMLENLKEEWVIFQEQAVKVQDLLLPMKMYISNNHNQKTFSEVLINIFKNEVVIGIKQKLVSLILDQIKKQRNGDLIDTSQIQKILELFDQIDDGAEKTIYVEVFEKPFILETARYFKEKSILLMDDNSIPDFLRKATEFLKQEQDRADSYLQVSTKKQLIDIIDTFLSEFIDTHAQYIIQKGLNTMLEGNKIDEVRQMYDLIDHNTDSEEYLKNHLANYIEEFGKKIMTDIPKVIAFNEQMKEFIVRSFKSNREIELKILESFKLFLNQTQDTIKELHKFLGHIIRNQQLTPAELELKIAQTIEIFRLINNKDFFEKLYKHDLAKRLLLGLNYNENADVEIIKLLKKEQGVTFMQNTTIMMKDIKISKTNMEEFQESNACQQLPLQFSAKILCQCQWPIKISNDNSTKLAAEFQNCLGAFSQYYINKNNNRKLYWNFNYGTAEIHFKTNRLYRINVSTRQMFVLVMLNNKTRITFQEIVSQQNIENEREIEPHLKSLCQHKILRTNAGKEGLSSQTWFEFNKQFTHKNAMFTLQIKEIDLTPEEESKIGREINANRKLQIQACLVRIMKQRKTYPYQQVISECTRLLINNFDPQVKMIKDQIENLIEREYLEREGGNNLLYKA